MAGGLRQLAAQLGFDEAPAGGAAGMLSQLLDADGDGSVMDDVFGPLMR